MQKSLPTARSELYTTSIVITALIYTSICSHISCMYIFYFVRTNDVSTLHRTLFSTLYQYIRYVSRYTIPGIYFVYLMYSYFLFAPVHRVRILSHVPPRHAFQRCSDSISGPQLINRPPQFGIIMNQSKQKAAQQRLFLARFWRLVSGPLEVHVRGIHILLACFCALLPSFRFSFFFSLLLFFFSLHPGMFIFFVSRLLCSSHLLLSASRYFMVRVLSACENLYPTPSWNSFVFLFVEHFFFRSSYFSGGFFLLCSRIRFAST